MVDWFEISQYVSTSLIVFGVGPEFYKIYKEKGEATDALSIGTGALFVLDALFRLPNVGNGLFNAIRNKDYRQIKQLGTAACGISLLCISFYALIVLQGIYNTEDTKETKHDKHIAQILSIVYGLCLLVMVIYFIFGFTGSTISTILILLMIIVYGILVIYGKKGIDEVEKKKKISQILTGVYSLCLIGIGIYYYKGIRNALSNVVEKKE